MPSTSISISSMRFRSLSSSSLIIFLITGISSGIRSFNSVSKNFFISSKFKFPERYDKLSCCANFPDKNSDFFLSLKSESLNKSIDDRFPAYRRRLHGGRSVYGFRCQHDSDSYTLKINERNAVNGCAIYGKRLYNQTARKYEDLTVL